MSNGTFSHILLYSNYVNSDVLNQTVTVQTGLDFYCLYFICFVVPLLKLLLFYTPILYFVCMYS